MDPTSEHDHWASKYISGEHKVSEWDRTEMAVAVSRYHIHPLYQQNNWLYDFAILTLLQPVNFPSNPSIRWWREEPMFVVMNISISQARLSSQSRLCRLPWPDRGPQSRLGPRSEWCDLHWLPAGLHWVLQQQRLLHLWEWLQLCHCWCSAEDGDVVSLASLKQSFFSQGQISLFFSAISQSQCSQTYGQLNNFLKKKPIVIFGRNLWHFLTKLHHCWFLDHNICTVKPSGAGDVCSGDSGNGVIMKTSSEWVRSQTQLDSLSHQFTSYSKYNIVGVVSYGLGCGSEFRGKKEKWKVNMINNDFLWKENLCQGYQGECPMLLTGSMSALRMELFVILKLLVLFLPLVISEEQLYWN